MLGPRCEGPCAQVTRQRWECHRTPCGASLIERWHSPRARRSGPQEGRHTTMVGMEGSAPSEAGTNNTLARSLPLRFIANESSRACFWTFETDTAGFVRLRVGRGQGELSAERKMREPSTRPVAPLLAPRSLTSHVCVTCSPVDTSSALVSVSRVRSVRSVLPEVVRV